MNYQDTLKKQHYGIIGKHSAVQICRWVKKSLLDGGVCYKEKFYGISSHKCCQISPWICCENKCLHCWRAIELDMNKLIDRHKIDNPNNIIEKAELLQRKLISGFKGNKKINIKKWKDAQNPENFAISLIGEPTLYPKLGELIKELRKNKKTSFLVTNGLNPEMLERLKKEKALPTQLYISLNYPNEEIFRKLTDNKNKNAWKKFNESLKIMKKLKTRRVLRMTLIKDFNMDNLEGYSRLIKIANPDFVEIVGFKSVGFARKRLGYERMPRIEDIREFAKKLEEFLPKYKKLDEHEYSRVVLLGKDKTRMKIKENEI